jgi:hypothetical protein
MPTTDPAMLCYCIEEMEVAKHKCFSNSKLLTVQMDKIQYIEVTFCVFKG